MPRSVRRLPESRAGAQIHERRLTNGLRILVAERHLDPVVAVLLFYRVGSVDEAEHEAGVSHFLEHMMFKGSAQFGKGAVDELTARLGGQNNAFTSYDHTGYWFELAADRWEHALEVEADRMRGLLLDPDEFDAERQVVLEELAMGEDDPWSVLGRRVEAALFQRHPYGRPIIGHASALAGLDPEGMARFHRRFYCPANATLVVAGDVTVGRVTRAARRHFGELQGGDEPERTYRAPIEEPGGETRLRMFWPDEGQRLCVAWPTVAVGSFEDDVLDVLVTLLTSGRRSRLQRRLVLDSDLALSVSAQNDTRVASGAFWIMIEATRSASVEAVEAALDEELERLAHERVKPAELDRARSILAAAEDYEGETVSDLAYELGGFAVDADWRMAFDARARLARIRPADVRDVAQRLLARGRRVVGWCLPETQTAANRGRGRGA
ncbi:MAG: pitrilysin family protein [Planctomycetota bacterium]